MAPLEHLCGVYHEHPFDVKHPSNVEMPSGFPVGLGPARALDAKESSIADPLGQLR